MKTKVFANPEFIVMVRRDDMLTPGQCYVKTKPIHRLGNLPPFVNGRITMTLRCRLDPFTCLSEVGTAVLPCLAIRFWKSLTIEIKERLLEKRIVCQAASGPDALMLLVPNSDAVSATMVMIEKPFFVPEDTDLILMSA